MKIRNKINAPKRLRVNGKIIEVGPLKILNIESGMKPVFDKRTFEIYTEQKKSKKSSTSVARKRTKRRKI